MLVDHAVHTTIIAVRDGSFLKNAAPITEPIAMSEITGPAICPPHNLMVIVRYSLR
jgi:hypothetical protein